MDLKKIETALKMARIDALYGPRELRAGKFAINTHLKSLLVLKDLPPVKKTSGTSGDVMKSVVRSKAVQ